MCFPLCTHSRDCLLHPHAESGGRVGAQANHHWPRLSHQWELKAPANETAGVLSQSFWERPFHCRADPLPFWNARCPDIWAGIAVDVFDFQEVARGLR